MLHYHQHISSQTMAFVVFVCSNFECLFPRPIPGSMTEFRGAEAQARVCSEMKELCSIIHDYGKSPCKSLLPPELQDATKVISFGELFSVSNNIS